MEAARVGIPDALFEPPRRKPRKTVDRNFAEPLDQLAPELEELLAGRPLGHGVLPREMPTRGLPIQRSGKHLYSAVKPPSRPVRQSLSRGRNLETGGICLSARANEDRNLDASYVPGKLSRAGLMLNQDFRNAFDSAENGSAKWKIVSRRATRMGEPSWSLLRRRVYARHSMTSRRSERSSKFIE